MNTPFFVVGLPRSRTAWMSVFLSCHHEAMNGCRSTDEYKSKVQDSGDCGTGLMLLDLTTLFPESPVVIIESDYLKAVRYAVDKGYSRESIPILQDRLDKMPGLRIPFDQINERLPEMWSHMKGPGYDSERAQQLMGLNIQVQEPYPFDDEAADLLLEDIQCQQATRKSA